jgi:hypothetical protein
VCEIKDITFADSTMLVKIAICSTSIYKGYFSTGHEFMEIKTTTSKREGPSSSKESSRSINDDSAIK